MICADGGCCGALRSNSFPPFEEVISLATYEFLRESPRLSCVQGLSTDLPIWNVQNTACLQAAGPKFTVYDTGLQITPVG